MIRTSLMVRWCGPSIVDDEQSHCHGELALAAIYYLAELDEASDTEVRDFLTRGPFDPMWLPPKKNRLKDLMQAERFLYAEQERLLGAMKRK